jgi:hypothetical protein
MREVDFYEKIPFADALDQMGDDAKADERKRILELQTEITIRHETFRFRDPPPIESKGEAHHRATQSSHAEMLIVGSQGADLVGAVR